MSQPETPSHTPPTQKADTFLAFLLLSTIPAFVAGIGTFAALWAVNKLRDSVWDAAAEQLPPVLTQLPTGTIWPGFRKKACRQGLFTPFALPAQRYGAEAA